MKSKTTNLRSYPSRYPSKVHKSLPDSEWRKERTLELYSFLPQTTLEERFTYTDIRDEVIFLNYNFFGYVASHVYLGSCSVSHEDKLQSALLNFCSMWHKFQFEKQYRTDLAFSVFFKPRLSECIYREMLTVKHTINRTLKMEAAEQLGKKFSELTYEDLSKVDMEPSKMNSLKAIFHADSEQDLETAALFVTSAGDCTLYDEQLYNMEYNDIEHLLISEMSEREHKLSLMDLMEISNTFDIEVSDLRKALPKAESMLYQQLQDTIIYKKAFTDDV